MLNTDARATARPATFDRGQQHRKSMLAKIHIAKKQLDLDEDDYRQILRDEARVASAGDADVRGLEAVLRRFEGLGFKALPKRGKPRQAQSPMAKKARALWISLYHLGEVRNRDEKALEAFARRQLGCERMAWANQREAGKLIEALKAMAERGGWSQNLGGKPRDVRGLQEALCEAILAKLKAAEEVPADWTIDIAAFRLCGVETAGEGPKDADGYALLAAQLGKKLRDAGGAA
jgi:phage gp16-like protein